MAAGLLPVVTNVALVLDLTDTVLPPCTDAVRDLNQFKDVLLYLHLALARLP